MRSSVIGKIYETTNYSMFQLRKDNRNVKDENVNSLIKSIKNMGLRHPISVDSNYRVQDGQHRLAACMALKIPVAYIVDENTMNTTEIAELQSSSKAWTNFDYVDVFSASDDGHNYKLYQDFKALYPQFSHSAILVILTLNRGGSANKTEKFKTGGLEIKDYAKSLEIAEIINKLSAYYKGYTRRGFIIASIIMISHKDFSLERLLRKMPKRCKDLMDFSKIDDYLSTLQDIYNWKESKKVYFKQ